MKRWEWIFAVVSVSIAVVLVCVARLLPSNRQGKPAVFSEVKKWSEEYKKSSTEKLKILNADIAEREKKLAEIMQIKNEDERLIRLAEFANEDW